jgi:hypothetical protein
MVPLRSIEAHYGDRRYSSYSFLTSALEGGEWSASRPGRALPPDKEPPVPIVQEAGYMLTYFLKAGDHHKISEDKIPCFIATTGLLED